MLAGSPPGVLRGREGGVKIVSMDATPKRSGLSLLLPVLTLLAALLASVIGVGAASAAERAQRADEAGCRFDPESGKVRVEGGDVTVRRDRSRLVFEEGNRTLDCGGGQPTVRETERVRIAMIEGTIYEHVGLDLRGGRFDAAGEIRFDLIFTNTNNGDEGATTEIIGADRDERVMIGRAGTKTALGIAGTSGPPPSPTVFIRARDDHDLAVSGGRGDDEINAFAGIGDGPIAPGAADLRLTGRGGADIIDGSDGDDLIVGDEGHDVADGHGGEDRVKGSSHSDTLFGGSGDDELLARDGLEDDLVDCGTGEDEAKADALDEGHVSRCETVQAGPGAGLANSA